VAKGKKKVGEGRLRKSEWGACPVEAWRNIFECFLRRTPCLRVGKTSHRLKGKGGNTQSETVEARRYKPERRELGLSRLCGVSGKNSIRSLGGDSEKLLEEKAAGRGKVRDRRLRVKGGSLIKGLEGEEKGPVQGGTGPRHELKETKGSPAMVGGVSFSLG